MQPDDRLGTTLNSGESVAVETADMIHYSWAGMAVSSENRLFVNFPRTDSDVQISVGEIQKDGKMIPFPDAAWNNLDARRNPQRRFLNVQDLLLDSNDMLWALDSGNPMGCDIVEGGAKLVCMNIRSKQIEQIYIFDSRVLRQESFLDDVEIDTKKQIAVITDSGTDATLIVDLQSGHTERLSYGTYAVLTGLESSSAGDS